MTTKVAVLEVAILACCVWLASHIVKAIRTGVANRSNLLVRRVDDPGEYWFSLAIQAFFIVMLAGIGVWAYAVSAIDPTQ